MTLLTPIQAFHVFYKHITTNYIGEDWQVRDVLGEANTDCEITCHTGGPTVDPAVWEDWNAIASEVLKDEKIKKRNSEEILLTYEQSLKVMECFLEKYWKKKNDISLNEIIDEIDQSFFLQRNFESTSLCRQWLECVPEGLKFKETFDDAYFTRLEEMRHQYWEREKNKPWNEIVKNAD